MKPQFEPSSSLRRSSLEPSRRPVWPYQGNGSWMRGGYQLVSIAAGEA